MDLLVRGAARFTADLPLPAGGLHAMVAVSPHAHATFTHLDTAAAAGLPGVRAVLTAADVPGVNQISTMAHDEPLLAAGEVHCVGEPIALVIADSADAAWRAAQLVTTDWVVRPAVLDAREAYARGDLLAPPRTFASGDVDAAWADCATVVSGRVDLGAQEHAYLETHSALAIPRDDGGLLVHSSTQSPSATQRAVAAVTGLPMNLVEVQVARLGGGFGGKEEQATPWAALAALGAVATGRPVRVAPDRRDDMRITGKRHPYTADFRLGLDAAGRFVAYQATLLQDAGCTTDLSPAILERSLFHATNAYAIPNVRITAASCRTNLPSNTAFRGFGAPQAIAVLESAIRAAARELGVPAMELQERNLVSEGDVTYYGMPLTDVRARECWAQLVARHDPAGIAAQAQAFNAAHPLERRGVDVIPVCFGIAFTARPLNQAEALVHVYADGTVSVTTGAVEMGQGVYAKVQAATANELGVPMELVHVEPTATSRVANVSPTAASTGADLNGAAAIQACRMIRAGLDKVDPDGELEWAERVAARVRRAHRALGAGSLHNAGVELLRGRPHRPAVRLPRVRRGRGGVDRRRPAGDRPDRPRRDRPRHRAQHRHAHRPWPGRGRRRPGHRLDDQRGDPPRRRGPPGHRLAGDLQDPRSRQRPGGGGHPAAARSRPGCSGARPSASRPWSTDWARSSRSVRPSSRCARTSRRTWSPR